MTIPEKQAAVGAAFGIFFASSYQVGPAEWSLMLEYLGPAAAQILGLGDAEWDRCNGTSSVLDVARAVMGQFIARLVELAG